MSVRDVGLAQTAEHDLQDRLKLAVSRYWSSPGRDQPSASDGEIQLRPVKGWDALVATLPEHGDRPAAFVKVFREAASFEREQRGLAAGQAVVMGEGSDDGVEVRVPALLSQVDAARALVMQRIEGPVLGTRIRRDYFVLRDRCVPALSALGRWLARLHTQDGPTTQYGEILDRELSFIGSTLELVQPRIGATRARQAGRLLALLGQDLAAHPRPLKWCHGDFQPGNVIVAGRTLYVVDFAYSGAGWPEQDLVLLKHNLRTGVSDLPFGSHACRLLWSAFLAGYRQVCPDPYDGQVWDLFELRYQSFGVRWRSYLYQDSARQKVLSLYRYALGVRRFRAWLDTRARTYGL